MAEDLSNPLLASLIAFNENKSAKTGVRKNDKPGNVSPTLTSNEVARYTKIFSIMKDVLQPRDEAARIFRKKQTKQTPTQALITQYQTQSSKSDSGGLLGLLGSGLGTLLGAALTGALLGGAEDWWRNNKDKFSNKIQDTFNTVFDTINFTKLIDKLGDLGKAINGLEAGINVGRNSRGGKALTQLGVFFKSGGIGKFLDNYKGLDGIRLAIMGVGDFVKGFFAPFLKLLGAFAGNPVVKSLTTVGKVATLPAKGGIKLFQMLGRAFTALSKTRAFKFLPYIGSVFNFATAMQAYNNGHYGRMWLEILSGTANLAGPYGMVGSAILDGGLLIYDLFSESEEGQGIRDIAGKVTGGLGKMFGSLGDALWGMITGIGNVIGNIFTSIYDWVVENANPMNWDIFSDDKPTVASAAKYGMTSGGYMPSMNDGMIYHNGTMVSINSMDDVLAAKHGGPIDKLLTGNSKVMKSVAEINVKQLEVLVDIREAIRSQSATPAGGDSNFKSINYTYNELTTQFG